MKSRFALVVLLVSLFLNALPFIMMGVAKLDGKTGSYIATYSWYLLVTIPTGILLTIVAVVVEVGVRVRRAAKKR
jgi:hypothetical protein